MDSEDTVLAPEEIDAQIAALKDRVDREAIRENLRLTPTERLEKLMRQPMGGQHSKLRTLR